MFTSPEAVTWWHEPLVAAASPHIPKLHADASTALLTWLGRLGRLVSRSTTTRTAGCPTGTSEFRTRPDVHTREGPIGSGRSRSCELRGPVEVELEAYALTSGRTRECADTHNHQQPGDPIKAVTAILTVAGHADPPLRLPLGTDAVTAIENKLAAVAADLDTTRELAASTAHDGR